MKVCCEEHGETICATAALEGLWQELQNFLETFRKQNHPRRELAHAAPWRYGFYRSTTRFNDVLWHERLNLEWFEMLICFDFMQNLTTPLANIETNTMFFVYTQMEMTVFGVLVFSFRWCKYLFAFYDLAVDVF